MSLLSGGQFLLGQPTHSGGENSSHVASLIDGSAVVVWKDLGVSNSALKFKILNPSGGAVTAELDVNPGQSGFVGVAGGGDYLSISGLLNGGFVVAWQQRANPTSDENIYYRVFDAAGNGGSVLRAHQDGAHANGAYVLGDQQTPDVTWTDTGFAIGWVDDQSPLAPGRNSIVVQQFDMSGVSQSLSLADTGSGNNGSVDLSYANGLLNAVWAKFNTPNGIVGNEIGGIGTYRADSTSNGPTQFTDDPSSAYGWNAAHNGLSFMTVWTQWIQASNTYEVRGSFDGDGANSFRINVVDTNTSFTSANVVGLTQGGWLVVWSDGGSDNIGGTDVDVIGQLYDANHQKVGTEFVITSDAVINNGLGAIDVDSLPDGRALVTWDAAGPQFSGGNHVFARYVDPTNGAVPFTGTPGNDAVGGTSGNDDVSTGAGDDTISTGNGDDVIRPGTGSNTVDGGPGSDTLSFEDTPGGVDITLGGGGSGTATLPNGGGQTNYTGIENLAGSDGGADTLTGNTGDNTLSGWAGADQLFGMTGNDILIGGAGDDSLNGGDGSDTADYSDAYQDVFAQTSGTASGADIGSDALFSIENLTGGNGNDLLVGDDNVNILKGGGGNDVIFAAGAHDLVEGGTGNDILVGNTDIFAQESDVLRGNDGSDVIYGEFTDSIDGGTGFDILYAVNAFDWAINLAATSIELFISDFGNDTIDASAQSSGVEVVASGGNDTVTGSGFADRLWGGTGTDNMNGGDGDDMLFGDVGADTLDAGGGNDIMYVDASDTINGGSGFDVVYMTVGTSFLLDMAASGVEFYIDQAGAIDSISAGGMSIGANIYTGEGGDTIIGSRFDDVLWGMGGNDAMSGGDGADVLVGGTGADALLAGTGTDRIYANSGGGGDGAVDRIGMVAGWGNDTLFDFEHGIDKIDMSLIGTSFAALSITATVNGAALVTLGGDSLTVSGLAGQLTAGDFVF